MPGWNPNMREVATGPSSSRGMQGAHSQLRRTIIAFTRPCDQSHGLAHSILVVWTPSLHEKALDDEDRSVAAFICPRVQALAGDSRLTSISTCTAVLFEFVAPAEARRMSRNVPKMIKKRHKAIRLHDCKVEAVKPRNGQSESSCGQGATSRWR